MGTGLPHPSNNANKPVKISFFTKKNVREPYLDIAHRKYIYSKLHSRFYKRGYEKERMSLKTDPAEEQEESYATDELSLEDQLSFQDKYQTLGLIGSGGQGQVYKVQDRASGEVYAAKRMPVDNFEDIEKLKNETRALQNLKHPLIPQYHGFYV